MRDDKVGYVAIIIFLLMTTIVSTWAVHHNIDFCDENHIDKPIETEIKQ